MPRSWVVKFIHSFPCPFGLRSIPYPYPVLFCPARGQPRRGLFLGWGDWRQEGGKARLSPCLALHWSVLLAVPAIHHRSLLLSASALKLVPSTEIPDADSVSCLDPTPFQPLLDLRSWMTVINSLSNFYAILFTDCYCVSPIASAVSLIISKRRSLCLTSTSCPMTQSFWEEETKKKIFFFLSFEGRTQGTGRFPC